MSRSVREQFEAGLMRQRVQRPCSVADAIGGGVGDIDWVSEGWKARRFDGPTPVNAKPVGQCFPAVEGLSV